MDKLRRIIPTAVLTALLAGAAAPDATAWQQELASIDPSPYSEAGLVEHYILTGDEDEEQDLIENAAYQIACTTLDFAYQVFMGWGFPWGTTFCTARLGVQTIEYSIYGPLYHAVYFALSTLLPDWVYLGYRHAEEVQVVAEFIPAQLYGGGGLMNSSVSIWGGLHDSQFCGMYGCACDGMADCFDGSYCIYEGAWGTCGIPIFD